LPRSSLVLVNETTGKVTLVGDIGAVAGDEALLAYDRASKTLYAGRDVIAASGTNVPSLAKVNPCNAAVTPVAPITIAGGTVYFMEGFAFHAGVLYAAASLNGACCSDTGSESLIAINTTTAVATLRGVVSGTANGEYDHLAVQDGKLLGRDSSPDDGNAFHLYEVNPTNGAPTARANVAHYVTAMSSGPRSGTLYAWILTGTLARQLVVIDIATEVVTPIGVTHDVTEFAGNSLRSLQRVDIVCP